MGCSSSNTIEENVYRYQKKSIEELSTLKERFLEKQKVISNLRVNNKIFDDEFKSIYSLNHELFEDVYDSFFDKHSSLLDPKLFNKDSFKDFTLTIAAQSYILKELNYKDYNIKDLIIEFVRELNKEPEYSVSDITIVEDLLNTGSNKFPFVQKGFVYSPESIKSYCFAHGHINNNFKFDPHFEVNVLNFVLIGEHIDNIGYLKGIGEIIESNRSLVSVCMQLYDNYDDNRPFEKSTMKNINIILEAIKNNTNIKALAILQSKGESSLYLGNEVFEELIDLIKKDFIEYLYLYRLSFDRTFGDKLGNIIPSLNNLKFLGFFSDDKEYEYLDNIFLGISNNNSLVMTVIQKYLIAESKIKEYRYLGGKCKTLKLLKYYKMINF
jgi:hypothetical protein